jgi:serine/threonine protein kinase
MRRDALFDVADALATVAATLAGLQRELGVAHRDIKPGNLYELDGEFLVGDFGLIAVPGAESLTGDGRQVGPAHFTAYEMILTPSTADPFPADVFSLGKTLWVLATGQRWPPEGHQPAGARGFTIGDFRPHARADALDREVDLMTRLRPEERPSMDQVAADLAAWKDLAFDAPTIDVSEAARRLRTKLERQLSSEEIEEQNKELAVQAARRFQELTRPINDSLKALYPRTEVDSASDEMTNNLLQARPYGRGAVWAWRRCTIVRPFRTSMAKSLRVGRGLELLDDGTLHLHLMVHVGPNKTMGGVDFHWAPSDRLEAPVGSIEADRLIDDGVRELGDAVQRAVEIFVDQLPDLGSAGS